jgi:hypothetical protein
MLIEIVVDSDNLFENRETWYSWDESLVAATVRAQSRLQRFRRYRNYRLRTARELGGTFLNPPGTRYDRTAGRGKARRGMVGKKSAKKESPQQ